MMAIAPLPAPPHAAVAVSSPRDIPMTPSDALLAFNMLCRAKGQQTLAIVISDTSFQGAVGQIHPYVRRSVDTPVAKTFDSNLDGTDVVENLARHGLVTLRFTGPHFPPAILTLPG